MHASLCGRQSSIASVLIQQKAKMLVSVNVSIGTPVGVCFLCSGNNIPDHSALNSSATFHDQIAVHVVHSQFAVHTGHDQCPLSRLTSGVSPKAIGLFAARRGTIQKDKSDTNKGHFILRQHVPFRL